MPAVAVRRARIEEVPRVADALARAFYDDPVTGFSWPRDVSRGRRLDTFFRRMTRVCWSRREVYTTDGYEGAAIWAPPDLWKLTNRETLSGVLLGSVLTRPRIAALAAYLRLDKLHPEEPHWYLEFLGTIPERQGHGVGGELMRPVLDRCDEEGVPVWTWSSNERNLAFYHRHRFEVLDKLEFAPGGPLIFPIRREPRG